MNKGLTLFAWITGCFTLFFASWFLACLAYYLILPASSLVAMLGGFAAWILPWCLLYGWAKTRPAKQAEEPPLKP